MVYFLFIIAQNNKTGNKRFLFTPSRISDKQRTTHWVLPPITNEKNYNIIVRKLLKEIFGTKRVINVGPDREYIKSYQSNKLTKIRNPIDKNEYPDYFLLNQYQQKQIKKMVDTSEMLEGQVLIVNVFYYIESVKASRLEKIQGYCEYHRTMVSSLFNANRKTSIVYDEKTDTFKEQKEPIISSIFRSLMGNTTGGGKRRKTKKHKISKHKISKHNNRKIRKIRLHNRTRKNRHHKLSYKK